LRETKRLRLAIFQVEAVMKLLSPEFNIRLIAPKPAERWQSVVGDGPRGKWKLKEAAN
jgi:hypothetical protein